MSVCVARRKSAAAVSSAGTRRRTRIPRAMWASESKKVLNRGFFHAVGSTQARAPQWPGTHRAAVIIILRFCRDLALWHVRESGAIET